MVKLMREQGGRVPPIPENTAPMGGSPMIKVRFSWPASINFWDDVRNIRMMGCHFHLVAEKEKDRHGCASITIETVCAKYAVEFVERAQEALSRIAPNEIGENAFETENELDAKNLIRVLGNRRRILEYFIRNAVADLKKTRNFFQNPKIKEVRRQLEVALSNNG